MQPRPHLLILGGALLLGGGLFVFLDGDAPAPGPSLGPGGARPAPGGSGTERGVAGAVSREIVRSAGGEAAGAGGSGGAPPGDGGTPGPGSTTTASRREAELAALRARNLEQRRASFERMIRARAVRIADEVGLGTGAEERIAQVYLDEQLRIEEIRSAYAAGPPTREARAELREALRGLKDRRQERFRELFGAQAAEAIAAFRDEAAIEAAGLVREPDRDAGRPGSARPE